MPQHGSSDGGHGGVVQSICNGEEVGIASVTCEYCGGEGVGAPDASEARNIGGDGHGRIYCRYTARLLTKPTLQW